jgi:hypothetical protein
MTEIPNNTHRSENDDLNSASSEETYSDLLTSLDDQEAQDLDPSPDREEIYALLPEDEDTSSIKMEVDYYFQVEPVELSKKIVMWDRFINEELLGNPSYAENPKYEKLRQHAKKQLMSLILQKLQEDPEYGSRENEPRPHILWEALDITSGAKGIFTPELVEALKTDQYEMLIGDEDSGRLPALLVREVLKLRSTEQGTQAPELYFVAGGKGIENRLEAIKKHFTEITGGKNVKALVISENIESGRSEMALLDCLREAGIDPDIASVSVLVRDFQPDNDYWPGDVRDQEEVDAARDVHNAARIEQLRDKFGDSKLFTKIDWEGVNTLYRQPQGTSKDPDQTEALSRRDDGDRGRELILLERALIKVFARQIYEEHFKKEAEESS